ncbi:MAG: penicillin-binding transpeptidase domain-containing protein [Nitrospirota bacterium]|nr:penicillin-binding transpeptidase domain-containing protein [Nitrospirota bacterium]
MKKNCYRKNKKKRGKSLLTALGVILFVLLGTWAWGALTEDPFANTPLIRDKTSIRFKNFKPRLDHIEDGKYVTHFENGITATYTLNTNIQERVIAYFERYKVPYGAFVAISPKTGKIMALADYSARDPQKKDIVLQASYPAASLFKVITAAAALEARQISPDISIPYRGEVNRLKPDYWKDNAKKDTLKMSMSEAFAKSNNIVFAKVAHRWLDVPTLLDYGERFQFNQRIPFENPIAISRMEINTDVGGLEKTAAGFGKVAISPLHAALITSTIANEGIMMAPCMIDFVSNAAGEKLYECSPREITQAISSNTAHLLKEMMQKTVQNGTVKNIFRRRYREKSIRKISIGGKTGSLRGKEPKGRYTWFVAMAPIENPEIVVAAMVVNDPVWHITAPQVAKEGLSAYFEGSSSSSSGREFTR